MKFVCLSFNGKYFDTWRLTGKNNFNMLNINANFYMDSFLVLVDKIINDDSIGRIIIRYRNSFNPVSLTSMEEVREQLARIIKAGKEIYFYADNYNSYALYLASVCTRKFIHKAGMLNITGFSITEYYFRDLLDKLKISVDVVSTGEGKSLFNLFKFSGMQDRQKEIYGKVLEKYHTHFIKSVAESGNKTETEIKELFDGRVLTPEDAVKAGWLDEISNFDLLVSNTRKTHLYRRLNSLLLKRRTFGRSRKRIAVLFIEGMIFNKDFRNSSLMGQSVDEDTIIRELRRISRDKRVKGLIIRINSGGGSVSSAQNILAEIERLEKRLTVVVSMGNVAASGGYWIALKGKRIFADQTTMTGSIGVVTGKIIIDKFLNYMGVNHTTVKTGKVGGPPYLQSYSEEEANNVRYYLRYLNNLFAEDVFRYRKIEKTKIPGINTGDIITADDALQHGLIDDTGSLYRAIGYLQNSLQIQDRVKVEFFPRCKRRLFLSLIAYKFRRVFAVSALQAFSSAPLNFLTEGIGGYRDFGPMAVSNYHLLSALWESIKSVKCAYDSLSGAVNQIIPEDRPGMER